MVATRVDSPSTRSDKWVEAFRERGFFISIMILDIKLERFAEN